MEVGQVMFEGAQQAYMGFLEGTNRRLAADARGAIDSWKTAAEKWERNCIRLQRELADAQARIAELELALAVEKAHAVGMSAMKDAFKAAHPQSPVLADSGQRYKSGSVKTKGALVYAAAFDRILRDARISNPEQYRAD